MEVLLRLVLGVLLIAHGLVHLLYFVTNADDPKWPLTLSRSWLVPEVARRPVGITLIAVTVIAFALLGLAVWGVPGLSAIWPTLAIIGSSASLVTLIVFWTIPQAQRVQRRRLRRHPPGTKSLCKAHFGNRVRRTVACVALSIGCVEGLRIDPFPLLIHPILREGQQNWRESSERHQVSGRGVAFDARVPGPARLVCGFESHRLFTRLCSVGMMGIPAADYPPGGGSMVAARLSNYQLAVFFGSRRSWRRLQAILAGVSQWTATRAVGFSPILP